ncbi:MAG: hypothetical protein OHK0015_32730 [Chloroflexi bacterium OHK40]
MVSPAAHTSTYRVQVASELDANWAATLDGWRLSVRNGRTTLERSDADQAALYGLLMRLHDLGLVLLAVERLDTS